MHSKHSLGILLLELGPLTNKPELEPPVEPIPLLLLPVMLLISAILLFMLPLLLFVSSSSDGARVGLKRLMGIRVGSSSSASPPPFPKPKLDLGVGVVLVVVVVVVVIVIVVVGVLVVVAVAAANESKADGGWKKEDEKGLLTGELSAPTLLLLPNLLADANKLSPSESPFALLILRSLMLLRASGSGGVGGLGGRGGRGSMGPGTDGCGRVACLLRGLNVARSGRGCQMKGVPADLLALGCGELVKSVDVADEVSKSKGNLDDERGKKSSAAAAGESDSDDMTPMMIIEHWIMSSGMQAFAMMSLW